MGSLGSVGSITGGGTNDYSGGTFGSGGSPGFSSDMMISAGGVGGSTQMDLGLSKEFQRFTVVSNTLDFLNVICSYLPSIVLGSMCSNLVLLRNGIFIHLNSVLYLQVIASM